MMPMTIKSVAAASVSALLCAAVTSMASMASADEGDRRDGQVVKNARRDRSIGRVILTYVPNRVFDVLDLVRLRVRVGPGIAARAHVTEGLDVGLGSYAAIFVGLPGPRAEVELPLPVGVESYTGIELGGDAELKGGASPEYTETEIGASVHALAGVDFGVDFFEAIDLAVGFLLIDFRGDDF